MGKPHRNFLDFIQIFLGFFPQYQTMRTDATSFIAAYGKKAFGVLKGGNAYKCLTGEALVFL